MPIEPPILDDLRQDRIVEELIRLIPVHAPEWTDHNESDPGITLIQLFAHLAEQVGYRLNRVPEKNHIELLKLLGVRLQPARAARTLLAFYLSNPATMSGFVLRAASRVRAKKGEPPPVFETDADFDVVPAEPVVLVTTKNARLWDLRNNGTAAPDPAPIEPPEVPAPSTEWHHVAWDGATPKIHEMPVDPVALFPSPAQRYLWVGLNFNPSFDAGFLGVRVTLAVQLDDDEQPDLTGCQPCSEALSIEPGAPAIQWLEYFDADEPDLTRAIKRIPGRIDDTTDQLARSGTIRFNVPCSLGPIPESAFADLIAATAPAGPEQCLSLASAIDSRLTALPPGATTVSLTGFQDLISGAITDAQAAALEPRVAVPHPLAPALRDPARVRGWLRITMPAVPVPAIRLRAMVFNAARATHATTVSNELIGSTDGRPGQSFRLANRNVLADSLSLAIQEPPVDPLTTWSAIDSLDRATPQDRVFELDPEAGTLVFGNGLRGRIPPLVPRAGAVLALKYRFGGGAAGNLPVGNLATLESASPGIAQVANVIAADGGADAEDLEHAKLRARKDLSTRTRAVTSSDFEWIALKTPKVRVARVHIVPLRRPLGCVDPRLGLPPPGTAADPAAPRARAGCCGGATTTPSTTVGRTATMSGATVAGIVPRCGPPLPAGMMGLDDVTIAHGAVSVVAVPLFENDPEPVPTRSFLRAVCEQLDRHRLVTTEVYVVPPQYMRLCRFEVSVRAKPGYTRIQIQDLVEARLAKYLHVLTGGEDGKGFPFGAQVHVADLIAQVFRTEGVDRVEGLTCQFTRTKTNAVPRQGRLVLCRNADDEYEEVALAPEENVSFDPTSFLLSTVS